MMKTSKNDENFKFVGSNPLPIVGGNTQQDCCLDNEKEPNGDAQCIAPQMQSMII